MIPKVIHYCWFGGNPLPEDALKCIESWKKYCPDFDIKRWDESNYDVCSNAYIKEAYEAKKWAFVSDFARLDIVYNNGGVYLDTDVEIVKPLDEALLSDDCFLAIEQPSHLINTGLGFGAVKGNATIKEMLGEYDGVKFRMAKDIYDQTPCPTRNTRPFLKYGFKRSIDSPAFLGGARIYPPEYFCPFERKINRLEITENTYSVHQYTGSWAGFSDTEYARKLGEYKKTHGAFAVKIKKNLFECEALYGKTGVFSIIRFVFYKIRKKFYLRNTENLALKDGF